jgi:divalent metal cation (Fe/Co/Zn/Cd) transporter
VDKKLSIEQAHQISHKVEDLIIQKIKNIKVTVHIEPEVEKEQL